MVSSTTVVALATFAIFSALASPILETRQDRPTKPEDCKEPDRYFFDQTAGQYCINLAKDVQYGETCPDVVGHFNNFTATQLYKWNPYIKRNCTGLLGRVPVVINAPGYIYEGQPQTGDKKDASYVPAPIDNGVIASCKTFQYMGWGLDEAAQADLLLTKNGISREQFLSWNRGFGNGNGALALGTYWSCVAA
ncbi:hypothetical protein EJ08DRAFT_659018 [Tothia fuscella]|uniref:LysM domain-containing protein n=1 Tax=Tothia fuscella TaxID=1048955 RepID=A0A9P4NW00_9PEZI|nr:hypothetical protein EJ08DRAFT_659018 [Tothia fuscella]